MTKTCAQCGHQFAGFGSTCASCRMGTERKVFICERCGNHFNGKSSVCDLCGGESNTIGPKNFCDGCHKSLTGTITKVDGKQYHPDCFKCEECGTKLVGSFARIDDKNMCRSCATKKKTQCVKCGQGISGPAVVADKGDMFHKECFRCFDCEGPLKSYVKDENRKFTYQKAAYLCRPCAEKRKEAEVENPGISPCAICGTEYPAGTFWCVKCDAPCHKVDDGSRSCHICKVEITGPGAYELASGFVFHPECFKCNTCGKSGMEGADFQEGRMRLITTQVEAAGKGVFRCSDCAPSPRPRFAGA